MVSTVAASCGLSQSALWGASAQQQKLQTCIEQTVADQCQLPATEQAAPSQAAPTAVPGKPISFDGKQALPCIRAASEGHNSDRSHKYSHQDGEASIGGQKPADAGLSISSLPATPVASARGNPEPEGLPCTSIKLNLERKACDKDEPPETLDAAATAQSRDGLGGEQPVSKVFTGVGRSQSIPALYGLIQQKPPRPRSRRSQAGSTVLLRSQNAKGAKGSSFQSAAAAAEATANTDQPQALRRCQHTIACMQGMSCNCCVKSIAYSVLHFLNKLHNTLLTWRPFTVTAWHVMCARVSTPSRLTHLAAGLARCCCCLLRTFP